MKVVQEMRRAY